MKEINVFEGWMNLLSEGTWALPDTPEKQQQLIALLADELPVGPDATNVKELLYDILGDDALYDQLMDLADEDANADARTIIINRLEQMKSNPAVAQVIGKLKIEQVPQVAAPAAEVPPVTEAELCETCQEAVCECGTMESADDEIQRISELSGSTLKSYIKKASSSSDERSASNLSSRAAAKLAAAMDGGMGDSGHDDDHKSYMRSKGIGRAVDRLEERDDERKFDDKDQDVKDSGWQKSQNRDPRGTVTHMSDVARRAAEKKKDDLKEISDETVQNYKDKAWDEFARGNDRRGAGIGRALDKQRGAFGHVKTTGQRDTEDDKLDELSPGTLGSYVKKAQSDRAIRNFDQGFDTGKSFDKREPDFDVDNARRDDRRRKGIHRAVDRMVQEDDDAGTPVESAILRRVMMAHSDLLSQYGPKAVMAAVRDVADSVGDVDEIGSSDVSAYVAQVVRELGNNDADAVYQLQHGRDDQKGLDESAMAEADLLMQEIAAGDVDIYDIFARPKTPVEQYVSKQIHDKVDEITFERGLHPKDDFEQILEIIQADLQNEYGMDESSGGGNFLESSGDRSALAGQYGHSGQMTTVSGTDTDMMARIKFLAGVTR